MKPVRIHLVGNAVEAFEDLNEAVGDERAAGVQNSERQQLLRSIQNKIALIKVNPQYGDAVPKALITKSGYAVDNLWVVGLTGYWRMLYTLKGSDIEILCFILHRETTGFSRWRRCERNPQRNHHIYVVVTKGISFWGLLTIRDTIHSSAVARNSGHHAFTNAAALSPRKRFLTPRRGTSFRPPCRR